MAPAKTTARCDVAGDTNEQEKGFKIIAILAVTRTAKSANDIGRRWHHDVKTSGSLPSGYGARNTSPTGVFSVLLRPPIERGHEVAANDVTKALASCCWVKGYWRSDIKVLFKTIPSS